MSGRSTEVKFRGTLAFTDVAAAGRLVDLVNRMLDKSMDVFWKAKTDHGYANALAHELGEVHDLCWNFVRFPLVFLKTFFFPSPLF